MKIQYHGGQCCGMSHIFGMGTSPIQPQREVKTPAAVKEYWQNLYAGNTTLTPQKLAKLVQGQPDLAQDPRNGMYLPRKAETGQERLEFCLQYIKTIRRAGCVEVVLTADQTESWKDVLEGLGFKIVNTFVNSNTGRTINVFHLNYGTANEGNK